MSARRTDPAPDPERAELERRYRRLLRWYPPSHGEFHREEMLGVLLQDARPGQRRPGTGQALNLAACGLGIRARRILAWLGSDPWQDALAVVSLVAPVLMLIMAALDFAVALQEAVAAARLSAIPVWQLLSFVPTVGGPAVVMIGWLAVVLLGLAGHRRAAAAIAFIPLALALADLLADVVQLSGAWSGGFPLFVTTTGGGPVVVASLAACSLAWSAGPRSGLAIAGGRRAVLVIAALAAVFGLGPIVYLAGSTASWTGPVFGLPGVLAIAAAIVLTRARGTVARKLAALVTLALLPSLVTAIPAADGVPATWVSLLLMLFASLLVWPVAIASWRGRASRAPRAG